MNKYCIYRITNLVNGKTYIGQHKYKKLNDDYMGSGKALHRAFRKYGIENFIKDIIIADIEDKAIIDRLEIKYIAFERTSNGNGCYNIAGGGQGGNLGEETKKKISETLKGHFVSAETRRKLSDVHKGKKGKHHSEETRRKISEAMKGKKCRPMSEETKKKIGVASKGRIPYNKGKHLTKVDGKCKWTQENEC